MIIDIEQTKDSVNVSYVKEDGLVDVKRFNVSLHTNNYGFYDYQICSEDDPNKEPNLRHYQGQAIKKTPTNRFDVEELREFLTRVIPEEDRNEIFAFRSPTGYAVDIELDLSKDEDEAFPDPYIARNPILSIQITAPNLSTLTLTTDKRVSPKEIDPIVEKRVNEYFKDVRQIWDYTDHIVCKSIVFESETDMLRFFYTKVHERLHFVFWWNGDRFDTPYLSTRCKKLGIDIGLYSPTGVASHTWGSDIDWWPKHRLNEDYMTVTGTYSYDLGYKQSMALDFISNMIFDIGKVEYDGSFKDLCLGPPEHMMFYGAVDTILLQMIHLHKGYFSALESSTYFCKIPIKDTWKKTAIAHAIIWDDLYAENMINAEQYTKKEKTSYGGGFVKSPSAKFVDFPVGCDFAALYPRIMVSHNPSFESFVKKAKDKEEAKAYFDKGYYVSTEGHIYKNDKDYTIKRVEQKLLNERGVYKKMYRTLKDEILHDVEQEMMRRGLAIDKKKLMG